MTGAEAVDVVVVGAGPAGLAAADATSARGLSVRLIDEQPAPGGQVWRGAESARRAHGILARPGVRHAAGATIVDAGAPGGAVRVAWLGSHADGRGLRETAARALVIATGATERPVLFPGATLPGVMGVGAVQAALKQSGIVPGGPGVVLAGQGPLLLLALAQVLGAGGSVDAVLDLAPPGASRGAARLLPAALVSDAPLLARGAWLLARARARRTRWHRGIERLHALGDECVEEVAFRERGRERRLPCRLLAVHDGVVPATQLGRLVGLEHRWIGGQEAFAPVVDAHGRASQGVWVAGDGAGIAGATLAAISGRLAGLDVARVLAGAGAEREMAVLRRRARRRGPARTYLDRLHAPLPVLRHADDGTILCRCEAVSLGEVRRAVAAGAAGPNRVKVFTRCGMGACQGRLCANPLTRVLAAETGAAPEALGTLRIRPPLKPVLIADYLGLDPEAEPT